MAQHDWSISKGRKRVPNLCELWRDREGKQFSGGSLGKVDPRERLCARGGAADTAAADTAAADHAL